MGIDDDDDDLSQDRDIWAVSMRGTRFDGGGTRAMVT